MSDNGDFSLIMPFVDQNPSFAYGFECGQLWQRMANGCEISDETIHAENREQIEKMCRRFAYSFEFKPLVDGWCVFIAKPTGGMN